MACQSAVLLSLKPDVWKKKKERKKKKKKKRYRDNVLRRKRNDITEREREKNFHCPVHVQLTASFTFQVTCNSVSLIG